MAGRRHVDGDPLTDPAAAVWAAGGYRAYLYGTGKRAPATVNAALAAVSDLAIRRWQRAAHAAPPRDRALAAVMRFAGARIAEAVGLDLGDLPATQRRRRLRIRGNGRKHRAVPVHPELAATLEAWLAARRSWPGAEATTAVFFNRAGTRLSVRAAGIEDAVTPHVLRPTFVISPASMA